MTTDFDCLGTTHAPPPNLLASGDTLVLDLDEAWLRRVMTCVGRADPGGSDSWHTALQLERGEDDGT